MKLTWLGHSAFRLEAGETVLMIDPFLSGNPKFEGSVEAVSEGCTHIALTHGHDDHVGDTLAIAQRTGATLVALFDLAMYLNGKGVEKVDPTNLGGTVRAGDFSVTFVTANHSSATMEDGRPVYLGSPAGLIIRAEEQVVYHMGDTDIFVDMGLIHDLYAPKIGLVPIGDRFTMGARTAAHACKTFFRFDTIIPMHYGTFPIIDQTPDVFVEKMAGEPVRVMQIGESLTLG